ncbi:MAG: ATP-binding cassette domain-containing protein [Spirosomataceae bacterium]
MQIEVASLGKKFNRDWIFRRLSYTFQLGESYTLVGPNGSGKSTLLQVIAGAIPATEGQLRYTEDGTEIQDSAIFRKLAMAAPYLELIEEFTLVEAVQFHRQFKPLQHNLSPTDFAETIGLADARHKQIRNFSSGMKQRLKLGLAFWSAVPILLLDEPTSNLDHHGVDWYLAQIETHITNRLVIICSNQPHEYRFCSNLINLQALKK